MQKQIVITMIIVKNNKHNVALDYFTTQGAPLFHLVKRGN
jgi:hypothetical protein